MRVTWDIFCRVIDNFGDIGVTWRLAKQLVNEHNVDVRLWIDDLTSFQRICPTASVEQEKQVQQNINIRHWPENWQSVPAADVVIEAFACQLPEDYINEIAKRSKPSLWLNLEYLSAETWVEGCHGLPSLQAKGLQKFFFFPGFTERTGGLLREKPLLNQRLAFQQDQVAQQQFLQQLGVSVAKHSRLISLFSYESNSLSSWLDELAKDQQKSHLLVPQGRIIADLKTWLISVLATNDNSTFNNELAVGSIFTCGALTIQIIPFVSQDNYDRLLWCCDFNVVRGEDSFIRAQWAGRPFLWHIYQQEENAHLIKLDAFLDLYLNNASAKVKTAILSSWQAWNCGENMQKSWQTQLQQWPEIAKHAENWCEYQANQTNLAQALADFYINWL